MCVWFVCVCVVVVGLDFRFVVVLCSKRHVFFFLFCDTMCVCVFISDYYSGKKSVKGCKNI